MGLYLLRRLASLVLVLWAMTVLVFAIVHLLPGSVAHMILGEYATPDAVARDRKVVEAYLGQAYVQ